MIDLGYPARGLAFIRHIETEESYAGSKIILTPQSRDKIIAQQFVVVSVGDYEKCEDEDCERRHTKKNEHAHDLIEGQWILCRNRSWGATPDPDVYVIKQSDVLARFRETETR